MSRMKKSKEDLELEAMYKKLRKTESKTYKGMTTREIIEWVRTH